jgi:hypothetical protein
VQGSEKRLPKESKKPPSSPTGAGGLACNAVARASALHNGIFFPACSPSMMANKIKDINRYGGPKPPMLRQRNQHSAENTILPALLKLTHLTKAE